MFSKKVNTYTNGTAHMAKYFVFIWQRRQILTNYSKIETDRFVDTVSKNSVRRFIRCKLILFNFLLFRFYRRTVVLTDFKAAIGRSFDPCVL